MKQGVESRWNDPFFAHFIEVHYTYYVKYPEDTRLHSHTELNSLTSPEPPIRGDLSSSPSSKPPPSPFVCAKAAPKSTQYSEGNESIVKSDARLHIARLQPPLLTHSIGTVAQCPSSLPPIPIPETHNYSGVPISGSQRHSRSVRVCFLRPPPPSQHPGKCAATHSSIVASPIVPSYRSAQSSLLDTCSRIIPHLPFSPHRHQSPLHQSLVQ